MEFPSSYDCLEDLKHAKDKKLHQSETFRQLLSWPLFMFSPFGEHREEQTSAENQSTMSYEN